MPNHAVAERETMKAMSRADLIKHLAILRVDPKACLRLHNTFIRQHPLDPHGYYARHQVWLHIGRKDLALQDLNKAISIEPNATRFEDRGALLRELGRYQEAIEDFNRAEALEPDQWRHGFGPLFRADCYARQGDERAALADCSSLPDGFAIPGLFGFPPGDKDDMAAELQQRAAAARHLGH